MRIIYLAIAILFFICFAHGCRETKPTINGNSAEVVPFRVLTFPIKDVKLLDGAFKQATELNEKILLKYEPDRFLAKFRTEAGLEPKAENYHGWEDNTIAGHSLGHYLTAICLMYETTGNTEYKKRADYIVDELAACQQADGDGYIGAFTNGKRILEDEVAKGDIRSKGFDLNGIWVPFYTQHKIMDGLINAYNICGNAKALEVNTRFTDWLYTIIKDLNDNQIQEILNCEHGGINETLAELFASTGNHKYLEMSKKFHHKVIIDSIAHGKNILAGKHANTQIPKFVGTARRYELTADKNDLTASVNFWEYVVNHHSYVTGGNCNHEYFGAPDSLRNQLSDGTTETCNVYNMLKLSEHLFQWEAEARVADFYERALFNHILSSQHPHDGRVIYNLSLDMGGYKVYQDPEWFTCCVGTGMENHSKYGRNIYYHNHDELFVAQFIASELNWTEKKIKLRQETRYPDEQNTKLTFECQQPTSFCLNLRYPAWAQKGIEILVNDEIVKIDQQPGSFIRIDRKWKTGDVVKISCPFSLRLETMPDDSNRVAIMYGPLVLAGDLGPEADKRAYEPMYVPVLMTNVRNPEEWIEPVANKTNTFTTVNTGRPSEVILKPFYKTHERTYSVYFDLFTQEKWDSQKAEYIAKQQQLKKLQEMTIDMCQMGEMQPERDHNFQSDKTWTNEIKNRKYREADRGGWFSFEMDTWAGQPMALAMEYYGGFPGSRTFDVFMNDVKLATENVSSVNPGEFFNAIYDLPDKYTVAGGKVTIKIVPHDGHRGGPLACARILKR